MADAKSVAPSAPTAPAVPDVVSPVSQSLATVAAEAVQGAQQGANTVISGVSGAAATIASSVPAVAANGTASTAVVTAAVTGAPGDAPGIPILLPADTPITGNTKPGRAVEVALVVIGLAVTYSYAFKNDVDIEIKQQMFRDFMNTLLEESEEEIMEDRFSKYAVVVNKILNANKKYLKYHRDMTVKQIRNWIESGKEIQQNYVRHVRSSLGTVGSVVRVGGVYRDGTLGDALPIKETKRKGGADPVVETYLPVNGPTFINVKGGMEPCGYREAIVRENGRYIVTCERTTLAGTKKCATYYITDRRTDLIPLECESREIKIPVSTQLEKTKVGNNTVLTRVTQQFENIPIAMNPKEGRPIRLYNPGDDVLVQPLGTSAESMQATTTESALRFDSASLRQGGQSKGPGQSTTVQLTNAQQAQKAQSTVARNAGHGGANGKKIVALNNNKKITPESKSAPKKGGVVVMPSSRDLNDLRMRNTIINNNDLDLIDLPRDGNQVLLPEPKQWKALEQTEPLKANEFYAQEKDETSQRLLEGFSFSNKHKPRVYVNTEDAKTYLKWLIETVRKTRLFYRMDFVKLYDPIFDTIGTLEAALLASFGEMEDKKAPPKPQQVWPSLSSKEQSAADKYMSPVVRAYYNMDSKMWISHVPMRAKTLLPNDEKVQSTGEFDAWTNLQAILNQLNSENSSRGMVLDNVQDRRQLPFRFPSVEQWNEATSTESRNQLVLSFLVDVQYRMGFAINFWHASMEPFTTTLFKPKSKRYLDAELVRYIDTFGNPDAEIPLMLRLQKPRADAIAQKIEYEKGKRAQQREA